MSEGTAILLDEFFLSIDIAHDGKSGIEMFQAYEKEYAQYYDLVITDINMPEMDGLTALPAPPNGFEGARVVYAEGTTVSPDRLKAEGVVFKQIPYQIEGA